jgi:hypothetical protein
MEGGTEMRTQINSAPQSGHFERRKEQNIPCQVYSPSRDLSTKTSSHVNHRMQEAFELFLGIPSVVENAKEENTHDPR